MGSVSDYFAISNSIDINDLQRRQQVQMRLAEFRERADRVEQQTGIAPLGFFGFEKESPTPRQPTSWGTKLLYTAFGAGLAALFCAPLALSVAALTGLVCVGGAIGLALGFLPESETSRIERAVARYDGYLTHTEELAMARGRARAPEGMGEGRRVSYAQTVLAEREQAAQAGRAV